MRKLLAVSACIALLLGLLSVTVAVDRMGADGPAEASSGSPTNGYADGDYYYLAFPEQDEIHIYDRQTGEELPPPISPISLSYPRYMDSHGNLFVSTYGTEATDTGITIYDKANDLSERKTISQGGADVRTLQPMIDDDYIMVPVTIGSNNTKIRMYHATDPFGHIDNIHVPSGDANDADDDDTYLAVATAWHGEHQYVYEKARLEEPGLQPAHDIPGPANGGGIAFYGKKYLFIGYHSKHGNPALYRKYDYDDLSAPHLKEVVTPQLEVIEDIVACPPYILISGWWETEAYHFKLQVRDAETDGVVARYDDPKATDWMDWLDYCAVPPAQLPDLTLSPDDIAFSNPNPAVGEPVIITATIHNIGEADAPDVVVQFFDGNPDAGGTQIGDNQILDSIDKGDAKDVGIVWSFDEFTAHDVFVVVDPPIPTDGDIAESDEENNIASKQIFVHAKFDHFRFSKEVLTCFNLPPDYLVKANTYLEQAYDFYGDNGFQQGYSLNWPFPDQSDKYAIEFANVFPAAGTTHCYFTCPLPIWDKEATHIDLRCDISSDPALQRTAIHEYFHAVQNRYIPGVDTALSPKWVLDGSADMMTGIVPDYPTDKGWPSRYDIPVSPYKDLRTQQYGASLFWYFIVRNQKINFGNQGIKDSESNGNWINIGVIRSFFEEIGGPNWGCFQPSNDDIADALDSVLANTSLYDGGDATSYDSFNESFVAFSKANLFSSGYYLPSMSISPNVNHVWLSEKNPYVFDTEQDLYYPNPEYIQAIDNYGVQYFRVDSVPDNATQVAVYFTGDVPRQIPVTPREYFVREYTGGDETSEQNLDGKEFVRQIDCISNGNKQCYDTKYIVGRTDQAGEGDFQLVFQVITDQSVSVQTDSPVDVLLADPDGLVAAKSVREIADSTYIEFDIDHDGDREDKITITTRKLGQYAITVTPEPDAQPTDTYTLRISTPDETLVLAENVPISEIPEQPYIILSTEDGIFLDTTPPEAHLGFDESTGALVLSGEDNLTDVTVTPDEVMPGVHSYVLSDEAGNTLTVGLEARQLGWLRTGRILSLQYGDAEAITPPRNRISRLGPLESVHVQGEFALTTFYLRWINQTLVWKWIASDRFSIERVDGRVGPTLVTDEGSLAFLLE